MRYGEKDDYSLSNLEENNLNKHFNASVLKTDNEFYKEEDNIKQKLINVKYRKFRNGGEDWEILEDGKVLLILKGVRFTNKEKIYFKTVEGIRFIMNGYKEGWNSVSRFKNELKVIVKK
jgi:hypothetical protein